MAKKQVVAHPTQHEDELTVTVFRFRGSSESMQKGFEAFGSALGAALGTAAPPARQVNGNGRRSQAQLASATDASPELESEVNDEEAMPPEGEAEPSMATAATPKPSGKVRSKLPKFDSKLDPNPFKAFAADRNPTTLDEKYLVACLWLQEESGRANYGPSQIFTCFRSIGWPQQDDFTQPMRTMKKNKSYFDNETPRGEWKLNPHGLAEARKIKHPGTA